VTSVRDPALAALATTTSDWQLAYDAVGRPVRERNPFGHERRTSYTVEGFVDAVELHSPSALIERYAYAAYDDLGNPGQIVTAEGTTEIRYDPRSRVEKVAYPGGSLSACLTNCERFEYDLVANRTKHVQNGIERRYQVDADDRLTAILDAQDELLVAFEHDQAGRRTRRSDDYETTYAYDALGRLRSYQLSNGLVGTLAYTATDERTARTELTSTTRYLGEWYETAPTEQRRLVHGPGLDNVLGQVSATSQVRTLWRDGTRNVARAPLDANTGGRRRYEAFGALRSTGGPPVERGFAGRPVEGLSGLINVRARHYDPATGRFLQPDPLGVAADQLYAYAGSNPHRFWDPTGRQPWALSGGGVGGGGPVQTGLGRLAGGAVGLTAGALLLPFMATPVGAGAALLVGGLALYEAYQQDFAGLSSYWDQLGRTDLTFSQSFYGALGVGELVGGFASLGSLAARAGAGAETTTLYRAVSHAEAADLLETGAFRAGPNSFATGKWFAESAEHAAQWGTRLEGADNFQVIETQLPRSAAEKLMRLERLDGIGPARFGTFEHLEGALARVLRP
jgi:RHS repeat-associated protein